MITEAVTELMTELSMHSPKSKEFTKSIQVVHLFDIIMTVTNVTILTTDSHGHGGGGWGWGGEVIRVGRSGE